MFSSSCLNSFHHVYVAKHGLTVESNTNQEFDIKIEYSYSIAVYCQKLTFLAKCTDFVIYELFNIKLYDFFGLV